MKTSKDYFRDVIRFCRQNIEAKKPVKSNIVFHNAFLVTKSKRNSTFVNVVSYNSKKHETTQE